MFALNAVMWRHQERGSAADVFAYIPTVRAACVYTGIALVPRGSRQKAEPVITELVEAAKAGERVSWGGEGGFSGFDGVKRFKVGSSVIAIRAQVPLVPVAFQGGFQAMSPRTLRARAGSVLRVRFGAPLSTQGLTEDSARELADRAQAAVSAMYAELGSSAR